MFAHRALENCIPRVALVCDLAEEGWPSMDLVGTMLEQGLSESGGTLAAVRLCPSMRRRFTTRKHHGGSPLFNADRALNRFWDYPRWLRKRHQTFDLFHVVDHSYSHLLHVLPAHRTVVTCHDLDTFRCLFQPREERRTALFRAMTRRILSGFQKAAWVTCDSIATKDALLSRGLVPETRVSVVSNGVHPGYFLAPNHLDDAAAERLLAPSHGCDLLHIGSTISRKRIDLLLKIFARVRQQLPQVRLIRVGGAFTPQQTALAKDLNVLQSVVVLPRLEVSVLSAVYRRCALTLLPSEREGFGLPLAESMACGTPVLASDLPALYEVGGNAAEYCGVAYVDAWTTTVVRLLNERAQNQAAWDRRRRHGIDRALQFTWREYARRMTEIYFKLLAA